MIKLRNNGIDANDRDVTGTSGGGGKIAIRHWPVFGMYEPDAIASFKVNGKSYYITANEGDARDWPGFAEEARVGDGAYVLDPTAYPNASNLKQNINLGRLTATKATGDADGDTDVDKINILGGRSFSIWDGDGNQVFDSGDELEQITASLSAASFNSDGTASSFDTRSDNKGPEIEAVTIGVIDGVTYAFVGSERTGDIFVYDVSDPLKPVFIQYINTPEDLGVEGLIFVPASKSPTDKPLVIASAEVSKTVAVFEVNIPSITATDNVICSGESVTVTASGSGPYLWSTGATTQSITVSPASTTTYSVESCKLTAEKKITVKPQTPCSVTAIPNGYVYTGGEPTNIYLGYGPQSVTLVVQAPWSGGPYSYSWSGGPLNNNHAFCPVFTATAAGNYTFTVEVTNRYGCVSTCSITICVTDIRVPGTYNKVYLCHDGWNAPPQTIAVNVNAVSSYLFYYHNDRLGKCEDQPCSAPARSTVREEAVTGFTAKLFPNPADQYFTLQVQSDKNDPVDINVTDIHGRKLITTRIPSKGSISLGHELVSGTYLVEVIQGDRREVMKVIKR